MKNNVELKKLKRKYFPDSFKIEKWQDLKIELEKLLNYETNSTKDLIEFWKKTSELYKIIEDTVAWLYINMTCHTDNKKYKDNFNSFMKNIEAKSQPYGFELNKKFYDSSFRVNLPKKYNHLNKIISNEIELFRKENVILFTKEQKLTVKFREIVGKMTVNFRGEKKTIQQMKVYLEDQDRNIREEAWRIICARYAKEEKRLNKIFDELKDIRVQISKNAGFKNYRDYAHQAKGRFLYSPNDLKKLHKAVEKVVVPFLEELNVERRTKLSLDVLRPWDFNVNISGEIPKAVKSVEELLEKTNKVLNEVDMDFGREFEKMRTNRLIDGQNRKGKAPGGYCYPIFELGSSFIFMHTVGVTQDIMTIFHEAGHAMHNMMTKDEPIINYISKPSEVAELASMSMELISLDYWDDFYPGSISEIVKKDELLEKLKFLPWGVVVDAFQHWIYLNPNHSVEERNQYFSKLLNRFKIGGDWIGLEKEQAVRWMMQLHIFQWPFYYIEYVIAQLGAIAVYRNYKKNPIKTIEQYKKFLKLSYGKPVSEIYKVAGINFDFSEKYVTELMEFLKKELRE